MKQFTFLKPLLMAAVMLLGGANFVWADEVEITETYDFGAFITANGAAPSLTTLGDDILQTGASEKVGTVKVIDNLTNGGQTLNLNGRFAVDYPSNAGSQIRFMWRSSGNAYQHGLAGNWNSKGTADPQGAARFSVLNLKAGDKITFTYAKQAGKAADPYTCRADMMSAGGSSVAVDAALTSGTQYTVAADCNIDLYFTNNNFAISKIVIVTTGTETVSTPSIAVTGCDAKARKVTITAGVSDAGNDVTTYYTTDGSTPTTSSASFTTSSQEITVGESATVESTVTVKAFSVSSLTTESSKASQDVTVGVLVQLAAPDINLSSFSASGLVYNPTYTFTSNQSGVLGNPSVTYSYSFASGASTAGISYTAMASGSITVTVSAEGYSSNSTVQSIVGGNFAKTYSFDAINDVTVDTSTGDWGNATGVNGAQWTFTDLSNCTYTLRADISLNNFKYARATTAQTKQGLYTRIGAGSIGFALSDGEFITFGMLDGSNIVANSAVTSQAFGQWTNVRSINVYTPATEADIAILDCKQYETSAAFATAVAAESFASAAEVYAFHTAWQIAQAKASGSTDIKKVIRNAAVADATDWGGASTNHGEQYTGAPDEYYIDKYNGSINTNQTIYGVPAGTYKIKAATRAYAGTSGTLYVNDGSSDIAKVNQITNVGNTGGDLGNGWSWSEMTFTLTETKNLLIGFWANASSSKWAGCDDWHMEITGVSASISSAGWATLYTPYALDFSGVDGLTAYTATLDGSTIKLKAVDDVPANTGVVLKGTASSTYNIPVITSSSTAKGALIGNATEATAYDAAGSGNAYYVLATSEDANYQVQFRPVTSGSIAAGKAYLEAPYTPSGSVKALNVVFSDATGIKAIDNKIANGDIFNLAGQRVNKAQKGFYIVNGKKVIVK